VNDGSGRQLKLASGKPIVLEYVTPATSRAERVRSIERLARLARLCLIALVCALFWIVLVQTIRDELKQRARRNQAMRGGTEATLVNLSTSLALFEGDCGRYPSTAEGLQALMERPSGVKGWQGPYVEASALIDAWERPLVYRCAGTGHPAGFDLISRGPDGVEGTADDVVAAMPAGSATKRPGGPAGRGDRR
jgi:type II secretion system protein G